VQSWADSSMTRLESLWSQTHYASVLFAPAASPVAPEIFKPSRLAVYAQETGVSINPVIPLSTYSVRRVMRAGSSHRLCTGQWGQNIT
jgi:hypothetical protein